MAANWWFPRNNSNDDFDNQLSTLKIGNVNNPSVRFHPYERREGAGGESQERHSKFASDLPENNSTDHFVGAIKRNIETLGGAANWAEWGGAISKRVDSETSDSFLMNGVDPDLRPRLDNEAAGVQDYLLRRAIRGSQRAALESVPMATAAHLMPLPSARTDASHEYQPLAAGAMANSAVASPPAYRVEMVSVAPGVQIQKKKFLPRYLPSPIGTPPGGLGRPILGRGSQLYSLTPQPDSAPATATATASAQTTTATNNLLQAGLLATVDPLRAAEAVQSRLAVGGQPGSPVAPAAPASPARFQPRPHLLGLPKWQFSG